MTLLTCPKCDSLTPAPATFCAECGARLGLSPEQLTKALVGERPKRVYRECHYCGRPCIGTTCAAHRKLLQLDPNFQMKGRAA